MPINPFIIIFSVLLVILCLVYCVLKKPRKPIMTGVFIALLIIYITCTFLINMVLSASSDSIISYDIVCSIVNLCIFQNSPATLQLESAFNMFKNIDIGLFAGAIIFMIYDIRNIVRQQ